MQRTGGIPNRVIKAQPWTASLKVSWSVLVIVGAARMLRASSSPSSLRLQLELV
jgi:hypothetical protein